MTVIEHPAIGRQRLRRKLERAIDKLILALDTLDGDPDLEDGGDDEPSLSFAMAMNQDAAIRCEPIGGAAFSDLEDACEDEGAPTGDDEPELGW